MNQREDTPIPVKAIGLFDVISECVIGAKHLRDGKHCEDAVGVRTVGSATLIAAADGHGSAPHGGEGAAQAVEAALYVLEDFVKELDRKQLHDVRTVREYGNHPMRRLIVEQWIARVRCIAAGLPVLPDCAANGLGESVSPAIRKLLYEYGSTLLFCVVTPYWLLIGQLGDGDLIIVDDQSVWRPIPLDRETVGEETASLCMRNADLLMQIHVGLTPREETLILLSTDGYAKSYATDADFLRIGPDYLSMIREIGMSGVKSHLKYILQTVTLGGSGDDITLAIVHLLPTDKTHSMEVSDSIIEISSSKATILELVTEASLPSIKASTNLWENS